MKSAVALALAGLAVIVAAVVGVGALLAGPSAGSDLGGPVDVGTTDSTGSDRGATSPADSASPSPTPDRTNPPRPTPTDDDDDDDDDDDVGERVSPPPPVNPDDDDDDDDDDEEDDD